MTLDVDNRKRITIFAGVNVLAEARMNHAVAETLVEACNRNNLNLVFKASFDKANRTSLSSYRGPGLVEGLKALESIKTSFGLPIVTDVHDVNQIEAVAAVCDVIQIPAFLSRQTDLLCEAATVGLPILVKKMQMMSPLDALRVVDKLRALGADKVYLCERGTSFGYQNLVVDFLGMLEMINSETPLIFDVSHALQQPGALGGSSGGRREYLMPFARAGLSLGIAGLFFECHPDPDRALCDGQCALSLDKVPEFIGEISRFDQVIKAQC